MRILFLCHSFNSLTQRLYVELTTRGHAVSVEFDIHPAVTEEAVSLFQPDVLLAPYLKRAIPEHVWRDTLCLVVHPGPFGDRGPAALDWAAMEDAKQWGVTVLQATTGMDAGPVWASVDFPLPANIRKSSLYRHAVTEAAVAAVLLALQRVEDGYIPMALPANHDGSVGRWRAAMRQSHRRIDWQCDPTATILKKVRAADGQPGVLDSWFDRRVRIFNGHAESVLQGKPGDIIAQRHEALCRATVDGAVWITHVRASEPGTAAMKLPATTFFKNNLRAVPHRPLPFTKQATATFQDLYYEIDGHTAYLTFDFYNGTLTPSRSARLMAALHEIEYLPGIRVIVLLGGEDFWCNGMDLNAIENAESPADASWDSINAIDDLAQKLLFNSRQVTLAVMRGNAAAGGVFLALCADRVIARDGIILNPHYKNMGNLFGSEFWTYLLPQRGCDPGLMQNRLPVGVAQAKRDGLIDDFYGAQPLRGAIAGYAAAFGDDRRYRAFTAAKQKRLERNQNQKPLSQFRAEELARMRLNFYGFDPSYHVARYHFVHRVPHGHTPLYLAAHRKTKASE